jgi:DNA-binding XRE family transcriptional regulator
MVGNGILDCYRRDSINNKLATFCYKRFRANRENMLAVEIESALAEFGSRLRQARLDLNESQVRFATRLAVSVPTLRRLEAGDPTVSLGLVVQALWVLKRLGDFDQLLATPKDPFAKWEMQERRKLSRQRSYSPRKKK